MGYSIIPYLFTGILWFFSFFQWDTYKKTAKEDLGGFDGLIKLGLAPHGVKLVVWPHGNKIGHTVGEPEEGGNSGDVPNVFIAETMAAKNFEVFVVDRLRVV